MCDRASRPILVVLLVRLSCGLTTLLQWKDILLTSLSTVLPIMLSPILLIILLIILLSKTLIIMPMILLIVLVVTLLVILHTPLAAILLGVCLITPCLLLFQVRTDIQPGRGHCRRTVSSGCWRPLTCKV